MLILGLLGIYFDAAVVFFTNSSLLFRLAVAILWQYILESSTYFDVVMDFYALTFQEKDTFDFGNSLGLFRNMCLIKILHLIAFLFKQKRFFIDFFLIFHNPRL